MLLRSIVDDIYDKKNGALEFVVKSSRATNQHIQLCGGDAHRHRGAQLRSPDRMSTPRFDEIQVGDTLPALNLPPISRTTLALFAGASGDHNPIHIDIGFCP